MTVQNQPEDTSQINDNRRVDCPDWCVTDHRYELDLISHESKEFFERFLAWTR